MRVLALDHGTKRVGMAIADPTGTLAQPLGYWPLEPFAAFVDRLRGLLVEKEVALILVGMPRNMDGSYGPAAQRVEEFVSVLRTALTVPVRSWDERLTTCAGQSFADRRGNAPRQAQAEGRQCGRGVIAAELSGFPTSRWRH
jgi:putative holliday junction resolvase